MIATCGGWGLCRWGLSTAANLAKLRMTVASGFSVESARSAPIGVSFPSVMYEFVFHSHSIAPEPCTNDIATLRSKSAASFSGVRREVSSRFSSRCNPVS